MKFLLKYKLIPSYANSLQFPITSQMVVHADSISEAMEKVVKTRFVFFGIKNVINSFIQRKNMYKLVHTQDFTPPKGVEYNESYNELSTPYVECSADEYILKRSHYTPQFVDYKQVSGLGSEVYKPVCIEWFHDIGYAIVWPVDWKIDKNNQIVYKEPVKYYRIGCSHKFEELSYAQCKKENIYHGGNCYHVYRCEKCGTVEAHDSSD